MCDAIEGDQNPESISECARCSAGAQQEVSQDLRLHQWTCDPAGQAEESKLAPGQKVKKESLGESPRESLGAPADHPKRVKNESPGDSAGQSLPVFLTPETHFWLFLARGQF